MELVLRPLFGLSSVFTYGPCNYKPALLLPRKFGHVNSAFSSSVLSKSSPGTSRSTLSSSSFVNFYSSLLVDLFVWNFGPTLSAFFVFHFEIQYSPSLHLAVYVRYDVYMQSIRTWLHTHIHIYTVSYVSVCARACLCNHAVYY